MHAASLVDPMKKGLGSICLSMERIEQSLKVGRTKRFSRWAATIHVFLHDVCYQDENDTTSISRFRNGSSFTIAIIDLDMAVYVGGKRRSG